MEYKNFRKAEPGGKTGQKGKGKHMNRNWQQCNHAITSIKNAKYELCEVFADLTINKRYEDAEEILEIIERLKKIEKEVKDFQEVLV